MVLLDRATGCEVLQSVTLAVNERLATWIERRGRPSHQPRTVLGAVKDACGAASRLLRNP
jgi:hypothetical protein